MYAACIATTLSALTPPSPVPLPASHAPFRLGSTRRSSTSRLASTDPRSRTCATCSTCAPRVPCPPSLESGPPRACRLRRRHPTPSRLPGRTSSRVACPPFDSAVRVGVQPAAQLRHVQGHEHEWHVLRALRACPVPQPSVRHSQCMCAACAAAPPTPSPASRPESWSVGGSHRMHSFRLGSGRRRLTSR